MKRRRFLVVRLASVGDVVQVLPLLRRVREADPSAQVDVLTGPTCRFILEGDPDVERLFTLNPPSSRRAGFSFLWHAFFLWWRLRLRRYEGVWLLHRSGTLAFYLRALGIRQRWGIGPSRFLTGWFDVDSMPRPVEAYQELFQKSGWPAQAPRPARFHPAQRRWLPAPGKRVLASNPGGGRNALAVMESKQVDSGLYRRVYQALLEEGVALQIFGDAHDGELAISILRDLARHPGVTLHCGKLPFARSLSELAACHAYLGNDSALLHMSAALGMPTVGLFTSTRCEPIGENVTAIRSRIECSPCYRSVEGLRGMAYRCPHKRCRTSLDADAVLEAVRRALSQGATVVGPSR